MFLVLVRLTKKSLSIYGKRQFIKYIISKMISKVIKKLPDVSNAFWKKILVDNFPDVQQTIIIIIIIIIIFIIIQEKKRNSSTNCMLTMICLVKIQTWIERKFQKNFRLNDIDMDDAIVLEKYLWRSSV